MSTSGYRRHIDQAHPLLREIFRPASRSAPRASLEAALADIRAQFVYQPLRGQLGFDGLREARARDGATPSAINCFDLSTLLASHLRRSGFSPDEVFVVLCDLRSARGRVRSDYHACVLVLWGDAMVWIDPADLGVVDTDGVRLLERYKVHVLWNDRYVYFTEAEKRRFMTRDMPKTGLQCFLYGQSEPALLSLMAAPGLKTLVEACFGARRFDDVDAPLIDQAKANGLLAPREDGTLGAGSRLVLVPAARERELHAAVAPFIDIDLGLIAEALPRLKRAYADCSTSARFGWEEVCHTVVAGMFLDLSVGAELHFAEDVQRTHGPAVVWAFENISSRNGFGVRWLAPPSHHVGVGQLWHVRVERQPLRLEPRMVEMLTAHARGERVALGGPDALYLRFAKLLRGSEITIPTFLPDDTERMLAALGPSASRIVEQALLPAIEEVKRLPSWGEVDRSESYRHAAVRLLLEYATDRVVDAGLLAPFPEGAGVASTWGTWLWIEPDHRPAKLVPASFGAAAEAS